MYCTGGLEPREDDRNDAFIVDGTEYVLTDKFKTMLRDSLIDWGTFLEVYHDNLDYVTMFDQIVKLLNVKENENLRDLMLPLVEKIYKLPAKAHLACMMKQFMIYEPVSIAVQSLFGAIKHHYEHIVERFIILRNMYIKQNNLRVKSNDWDKLTNEWGNANADYNLDSSSVVLLFINPPKHLKSGIHYKIPGKEKVITELRAAIKQFKYPGFCPKVPHQRLAGLLKFPLDVFVKAIKAIAPDEKFPDYKKIEREVTNILKDQPKKPEIKDDNKREKPPTDLFKRAKVNVKELRSDDKDILSARLHLAQWYVTKTLDYRKKLLSYGKAYEEYYIKSARMLSDITDLIKRELRAIN